MFRWISAGAILFIPGVNFLSLGYLLRSSDLSMIGGIGLPTWERKNELWWDGAKLACVVVLYEALPSFLFSFGFLLSSFGNPVTVFIGGIMRLLSIFAFVICSFFIPFAFCVFIESVDVRRAFEFERIAGAVKEVLVPYACGYCASVLCVYIAYRFHSIPYLIGFLLSSILIYYVLLVSTYFFTQLFKRTTLATEMRL
jgi:hypothetical protein